MALTVNKMDGFESGALFLASASTGTPDVTEATIVRSGIRSLRMDGTAAETYTIDLFSEVANAGNDHVFGFGIYLVSGVTPSSETTVVQVLSTTSTLIGNINLQTDGTLHLRDTASLAIDGTTVLKADTWYFVEVYFQSLDSGSAEFFVNDVSQGTASAKDFLNGAVGEVNLLSDSALDGDILFDDFYWMSGATAATDRLGSGTSVLAYQPGLNSAQPDFDETGVAETGSTNDLDIGTWLSASIVPWTDATQVAEYTVSNAIGGCAACDVDAGASGLGPSGGDKIVSGTIKAGMWAWRGDRSGGGATTQQVVFGSFDGAGNADMGTGNPTTVTLDSGAPSTHVVLLEASDAGVPSATDTFVIGIANDGGRDFELIDYQCFLLHVSETVVTDLSDGLMPEYPSPGLTVEV